MPVKSFCSNGRRLALGFALLGVLSQPATAYSQAPAAPAATSANRISPEQAMAVASGAEPSLNNQRYSDMGGDELFDADSPAIAYNSANHEYLVV